MNDPIETVRRYIEAFNKGDVDTMAALFAVPGTILDGMPPHLWHGPTATRDWYRDVEIEAKQHGVSGYEVSLGAPLHNVTNDDAAYLVVPASLKHEMQGKQHTQTGASLTVALRKHAGEWRIAAWAWTKG